MSSSTDDRPHRGFDYAADVGSVATARRDVSAFVTEHFARSRPDLDDRLPDLLEPLILVVSELCSNAVEATPGLWFRVEITIEESNDEVGPASQSMTGVICSVINDDSGGELNIERFGAAVDPLADRGRGLVIVGAVADGYRVEQLAGTTVVTAELSLDTRR